MKINIFELGAVNGERYMAIAVTCIIPNMTNFLPLISYIKPREKSTMSLGMAA
jgi:hypothetical protein